MFKHLILATLIGGGLSLNSNQLFLVNVFDELSEEFKDDNMYL